MTKKEQVAFKALMTHIALSWPKEAEPIPTVKSQNGETVEGYTFNSYNREVKKTWSSAVSHGYYYDGKRMSGSRGGAQGGRLLYATWREAMVALRWEVCRKMASDLYAMDCTVPPSDFTLGETGK